MIKQIFFTLLCLTSSVAGALEPDRVESPVEKIEEPVSRNKVTVGFEHSKFNRGFSSWDQGFISYGRKFSFGSVIARYNRARRFDTHGEQMELDAYPKIRPGTYAYLNYGHSKSGIFPKDRYGAEIFQGLGGGFEGSLGWRRLDFSTKVTLWTLSVAKYWRSYYFYFRPYYTPSEIGA